MRRTVKILVVLGVVVAVASAGAWAQSSPKMPVGQRGDTYLRSDIWKNVVGSVTQMPTVNEQQPQPASRPGTDSSKGLAESMGGGSAIPTSSFGAAFLTPSERTGNEIRKVIKRLG